MAFVRLHEITIDCVEVVRVAAFWAGLLGGEPYEPMPGWLRLGESTDGRPMLNFQPVLEPKQGKARVHLDLLTDDVEATLARVVELGGRATGERHEYDAGTVVVLADPEGTEFCVVGYRTCPEHEADLGHEGPPRTAQVFSWMRTAVVPGRRARKVWGWSPG